MPGAAFGPDDAYESNEAANQERAVPGPDGLVLSTSRTDGGPPVSPSAGAGGAICQLQTPGQSDCVDGFTTANYDEISPPLVELVKQQPGFVLHVAPEDSRGFCVSEIWETKDQHDSYFDEHVVPNVPGEIEQEVVELHSVVKP